MLRWIAPPTLGLALLSSLAAAQPEEGLQDVPAALQGTWGRKGRCDVVADRLTISARTARHGRDAFAPVYYSPGEKAVFWNRQYESENFVAGRTSEFLVDDTEGFGMPGGQVGYARCGPGLARVPWPYK